MDGLSKPIEYLVEPPCEHEGNPYLMLTLDSVNRASVRSYLRLETTELNHSLVDVGVLVSY
jgi:hypothetical protein